jgi:chemotaxis methyl-accepting protein methylase
MARLLIVLLSIGLFAIACGSGEEPQPTGTATSERAEREATVGQEAQEEDSAVAEQASETAAEEEAAEQIAEQVAEQVAEQAGDGEEQAVVELPAEIVGEHKGVRSAGRVLGEPDAPVLIEHFGDFT